LARRVRVRTGSLRRFLPGPFRSFAYSNGARLAREIANRARARASMPQREIEPQGPLSHAARVDHRAGVALEALAELEKLRLVGEELAVVVYGLVREDRLLCGGGRGVGCGRPLARVGVWVGVC